jgi:hypothetical protein
MVKTLYRWTIALVLLPVCYGMTRGLLWVLTAFKDVPENSFYFFMGVGSYFAFQWVFFRPMRTYVFGHELTHAIAAWMSGGKVKNFKVGKSGGSVSVSKTNLFVALAPYFVPLYAVLVFVIYAGVNHFYPLELYWRWTLWLIGVAVGFHAALTVYALMQNQPDLKMGGIFLSGVLIYLGNMILMSFFLSVLFPKTASWTRLLHIAGHETWWVMKKTGEGSLLAWHHARRSANL